MNSVDVTSEVAYFHFKMNSVPNAALSYELYAHGKRSPVQESCSQGGQGAEGRS